MKQPSSQRPLQLALRKVQGSDSAGAGTPQALLPWDSFPARLFQLGLDIFTKFLQ